MKREPTDDATESKNLRMDGHLPRGNRESDGLIVPKKQANKAGPMAAAESVEGRGSTKGNVAGKAADRTQSRKPASIGLRDVRKAAINTFTPHTRGRSRMR